MMMFSSMQDKVVSPTVRSLRASCCILIASLTPTCFPSARMQLRCRFQACVPLSYMRWKDWGQSYRGRCSLRSKLVPHSSQSYDSLSIVGGRPDRVGSWECGR